jgi:hypothetical protein
MERPPSTAKTVDIGTFRAMSFEGMVLASGTEMPADQAWTCWGTPGNVLS